MTGPQLAIVGAGPAGFYVADALCRKLPECHIALIDRLPTPFGLVRGGVAPDHQGTKNITRQFERTLTRGNVRFFGNVELGRDIGYEELKRAFDVVVLCTGAPVDRRLDVPGESLPGVYGSGVFVSWYNGMPDQRELNPLLDGAAVAVIGNGNVAIDIVRLLCKSPAELAVSDICEHVLARLSAARPREVYLIGRRGPLEASFTAPELEELGSLADAAPALNPALLPAEVPADWPEARRKDAEKNLGILRRFAAAPASSKPVQLRLLFNAAPSAIMGSERVAGLRLERTRLEGSRTLPTGVHFDIAVGTVVTAIGYRSAPLPGVPFDDSWGVIPNAGGRVLDPATHEPLVGQYTAGWIKRGPTGVIGTNKPDAAETVENMLADARAGHVLSPTQPTAAAAQALVCERQPQVVTYADWQRLDALELSRGKEQGRPRIKFTRVEDMLAALRD